MIGVFKTDKDYLKAVKTLINSTQETNHRIDFFKEKILPFVNKSTVLDIGVGNGELSKSLYKSFESIDLVDSSLSALNSIDIEDFPNQIINKHHLKIEDYNLPDNYFDLIINSHTLYYVKRNLWKNLIQDFVSSLKSEGYLVIVLNDGLERAKLARNFGTCETSKIELLIEECLSIQGVSLQIFPMYETFEPSCLSDALEIVNVCFCDIGLQVEKKLLIDCLNKSYKKEATDGYSISFIQYFFILKKIINNDGKIQKD